MQRNSDKNAKQNDGHDSATTTNTAQSISPRTSQANSPRTHKHLTAKEQLEFIVDLFEGASFLSRKSPSHSFCGYLFEVIVF